MPDPVLLVEDEGSLRELFSRALARAGYTVLVAGDSESALKFVGEIDGVPFVLLTDVLLPGMNGLDLAKTIVRLGAAVKVGFMTGGFDEKRMELDMRLGCRSILRKPFTISELVRFVEGIATQCGCDGLADDQSGTA